MAPIAHTTIIAELWRLGIDFLVVIVASGIARGRVRTTAATTVESRKMAAILQIIG